MFPQNACNSLPMVVVPIRLDRYIYIYFFKCISPSCEWRWIALRLVSTGFGPVPSFVAVHSDVRNACAHYCGVFVCRGTLQLLCGGGDMVEAILMQWPPLPESAPILFFPFHCDSCWDRLLGDHIPGTKRAQLVWTGLSDTTSCSGCEESAINASLTCHVFVVFIF